MFSESSENIISGHKKEVDKIFKIYCKSVTCFSTKAGLHVDHLIQKCYISVSEDGTDVAARLKQSQATLRDTLEMKKHSRPFYVTHPFAFCVFQPHSGFILFAGIVVDPHIAHHKPGQSKKR